MPHFGWASISSRHSQNHSNHLQYKYCSSHVRMCSISLSTFRDHLLKYYTHFFFFFCNLSTFRLNSVKPQDCRLAWDVLLSSLICPLAPGGLPDEWSGLALRWESEGHPAITLPPSVPSTTTTSTTLFWSLISTGSFVCSNVHIFFFFLLSVRAYKCMQASYYTTKWRQGV